MSFANEVIKITVRNAFRFLLKKHSRFSIIFNYICYMRCFLAMWRYNHSTWIDLNY